MVASARDATREPSTYSLMPDGDRVPTTWCQLPLLRPGWLPIAIRRSSGLTPNLIRPASSM